MKGMSPADAAPMIYTSARLKQTRKYSSVSQTKPPQTASNIRICRSGDHITAASDHIPPLQIPFSPKRHLLA